MTLQLENYRHINIQNIEEQRDIKRTKKLVLDQLKKDNKKMPIMTYQHGRQRNAMKRFNFEQAMNKKRFRKTVTRVNEEEANTVSQQQYDNEKQIQQQFVNDQQKIIGNVRAEYAAIQSINSVSLNIQHYEDMLKKDHELFFRDEKM